MFEDPKLDWFSSVKSSRYYSKLSQVFAIKTEKEYLSVLIWLEIGKL
jgi:hypothetical protein